MNVFWRDPTVPTHFIATKDLYGNVDPLPATTLLSQLDDTSSKGKDAVRLLEAIEKLNELPEHYRQFYARMFMGQLRQLLSL